MSTGSIFLKRIWSPAAAAATVVTATRAEHAIPVAPHPWALPGSSSFSVAISSWSERDVLYPREILGDGSSTVYVAGRVLDIQPRDPTDLSSQSGIACRRPGLKS